jgi:hypothetical protein
MSWPTACFLAMLHAIGCRLVFLADKICLIFILYYFYSCHGRCWRKTKAQGGERTFYFILKCHQQNNKWKKKPWSLQGKVPQTKLTTHSERRAEKGLPTYDSQSETTIDSCPWLRTIPGQNKEIPKHPNEKPNQNRDIKISLTSGRDNSKKNIN